MIDRFIKAIGTPEDHPGVLIPRTLCTLDYLGNGLILEEINPPTKILRNFLKTWGDRKNTRALHTHITTTSSSVDGQDSASVALNLLRWLIAVGKMRKILNIEAGLEMIAFGMAICSEVWFSNTLKAFSKIPIYSFSIRMAGCFLNWWRMLKRCWGGLNFSPFNLIIKSFKNLDRSDGSAGVRRYL